MIGSQPVTTYALYAYRPRRQGQPDRIDDDRSDAAESPMSRESDRDRLQRSLMPAAPDESSSSDVICVSGSSVGPTSYNRPTPIAVDCPQRPHGPTPATRRCRHCSHSVSSGQLPLAQRIANRCWLESRGFGSGAINTASRGSVEGANCAWRYLELSSGTSDGAPLAGAPRPESRIRSWNALPAPAPQELI